MYWVLKVIWLTLIHNHPTILYLRNLKFTFWLEAEVGDAQIWPNNVFFIYSIQLIKWTIKNLLKYILARSPNPMKRQKFLPANFSHLHSTQLPKKEWPKVGFICSKYQRNVMQQTKYNEQNQKIEFSFFIFSLDGMKKHGKTKKTQLFLVNYFVWL